MDVNKLLDELEELVEQRPLPVIRRMRPFRKVFFLDVDDVLDYTHQIRASLPQQIQRADQITREKDRILEEAREQAERMVREASDQGEALIHKAHENAKFLISNDEIARQAKLEGQRIVEQASQEGDAIRAGAMEYARTVLDTVNKSLANVSEHIGRVQQAALKAREEIQG